MAHADRVLPVAVEEAALQITSTPEDQRSQEWYERRIKPLIELANKARLGDVSDADVRDSGIHPQQINLHGLLSED